MVSPSSLGHEQGSSFVGTPSQSGTDPLQRPEIPVYDPADPSPVHHLIIYLIEIFFSHLGCNYPFLKREKFLRLVQQKRAEPILVDAVCALASRFSDHALLPHYSLNKARSEHGHNFAQRAKSGVVDTFPCPTVAAVQACLLLAYEGFGDAQDSALWMFLGCSIRMLLDLGIHKIDGVKHRSHGMGFEKSSRQGSSTEAGDDTKRPSIMDDREKMEIEQEQVDTLWAVFILDRVISSGTGRPVSLRDEDFELEFPDTASIMPNGWPAPFPALIRVIHLYGKITDVINSIRDVKGFQEQMKSLSAVESALTKLYQRLDARLNFSAPNFQHYVKFGQGTTFLLLHLWFHAGIMLLHQPTLLHSFEGQIQQLLPNSRELSMSSAKTISDILAFAEVIDGKSLQGNPFTSQPCYIAACAFLMEISSHTSSHPSSNASHPSSGASSPPRKHAAVDPATQDPRAATGSIRHSLLASAANQNYQRCYKALQQLETYWAGAKYIITALDQKAKGIWDPETFTQEEMEATKLPKPELPQGWNRRSSLALQTSLPRNWSAGQSPRLNDLGSPPMIDPAQAIGFSLTGTTNSPSSNLTFLYQPNTGEPHPPPARQSTPSGTMIYDPIRQSLPEAPRHAPFTSSVPSGYSPSYATHGHPRPSLQQMLPPPSKYHPLANDPASRHDAEMLLGLQNSPYSTSLSPRTAFEAAPSPDNPGEQQRRDPSLPPFPYSHSPVAGLQFQNNANSNANYNMDSSVGTQSMSGFGDMMMASQEIDMSALGGDMMPWLEYLPSDMMSFFENAGMGGGEAQAGGEMGDMGNDGSG